MNKNFFTAGYRLIAGLDEVGRGALAGPVSVGVAVLDQQNQQILEGLTDSKALTPKRREALIPRIQKWCSYAIGHTTPAEIDVFRNDLRTTTGGAASARRSCPSRFIP